MASTISSLTKLNFKPGFHQESTQYSEEGSWFDGDRVRFREGRPENIRGYSQFDIGTGVISGIVRDILTWANNNTQNLLSVGTESRLYLVDGSILHDITPIVSTVSIGTGGIGNFTTSTGNAKVFVSLTNNNVSIGDFIEFTSTSLNGFSEGKDFATSAFGGPVLEVVSVTGTNNFAVSVKFTADSNQAGPGHGTANFLLPTGANDSIQGTGYGADLYNAGVSITGARAWSEAAASSTIIFAATQWSLDNFGEDLLGVKKGNKIVHWDVPAALQPVERATIISASPLNVNSLVVSPNDRHVIALGANEFGTGIFNPLLIRWSDQQDYTNWTPSVSSTSGELPLVDGTQIIGASRTRNSIHVWTDNALYGLQFTGPPFIFGVQQLGSTCGLIGPHASVAIDGTTFWMSDDNFFVFDGSVRKLDCTVRRHVFDNFNLTQKEKVYGSSNSEFHEITWLYPSSSSAEPDSYVIYNYMEKTWVYGSGFFGTFADDTVFSNTLTTGKISTLAPTLIWNNEPANIFTGDGEALSSFLESADFDLQDGNDIMFLNRVIPDITLTNGGLNFSINLKDYPSGPSLEKGPYEITSQIQKIDLRARGRQANVRVSSSDLNVSWRWGDVRMALQADGKR
jgi:hypothetical protein